MADPMTMSMDQSMLRRASVVVQHRITIMLTAATKAAAKIGILVMLDIKTIASKTTTLVSASGRRHVPFSQHSQDKNLATLAFDGERIRRLQVVKRPLFQVSHLRVFHSVVYRLVRQPPQRHCNVNGKNLLEWSCQEEHTADSQPLQRVFAAKPVPLISSLDHRS